MLDDFIVFKTWECPDQRKTVILVSNGYTKAKTEFFWEHVEVLSETDVTRLKYDAVKRMQDDLHWRTPLAHAHRRTDGNAAPHGS